VIPLWWHHPHSFTGNIYRPLFPNKSPNHYLFIGRITSLFIVAGGVSFAFLASGSCQRIGIFWKISPMMGIVFWLGLFWRRTTVSGACAATFLLFHVVANHTIRVSLHL
jgi:SSS family solute:Na+ symporter